MSRFLRRSTVAVLAAAALAVAGCGSSDHLVVSAETEGIYLDLGGMKYQIQMSRYLNPNDVEDRDYMTGLPSGDAATAEEVWFGVWMRVQNETGEPLQAATEYEIHDTQEQVFRPVAIDPKANVFAYQGGTVEPRSILPKPDSAAGAGPIQGSLLLFKIKVDSLQNRPLELKIKVPGQTGTASLDV
jgi:hypothetical protein